MESDQSSPENALELGGCSKSSSENRCLDEEKDSHMEKVFFFLKPTSVGVTKCLRCYQEGVDSGLGSGFLVIKELGMLEWCLDRIEYVSD